MNLTFHHFCKELRYLLPRWLAWLPLLAFTLAYHLEAISPLVPGAEPARWWRIVEALPWAAALWLSLSYAPEDGPARVNRFLATRPFPSRCYWQARGLVFLCMIVLPLMVEHALYLSLSGRPFNEVAAGTLYRGFIATAALAWTLPFTALWHGRAAALGAGLMAVTLWGGSLLADILMRLPWEWIKVPYRHLWATSPTVYALLLLGAAGLAGLALWHRARPVALRLRLAGVVCLTLAVFAACVAWQSHRYEISPGDPTRAKALAARTSITTIPSSVKFTQQSIAKTLWYNLELRPRVRDVPPGISVVPRRKYLHVTQNGTPLAVKQMGDANGQHPGRGASAFPADIHSLAAMAKLFPPGTLMDRREDGVEFALADWYFGNLIPPLADVDSPLTIQADFDLDWWEWHQHMDLPLQRGNFAQTEDLKCVILNVRLHEDSQGRPKPGAVTVDFRLNWRTERAAATTPGISLLLYSPDRTTAWLLRQTDSPRADRAENEGWQRRVTQMCWENILKYADGQDTAVRPENLRVIAVEAMYLGTTPWNWRPEPLVPRRHMPEEWSQRYMTFGKDELIYPGRRTPAFRQRLNSLPAIAASSTKSEVAKYVGDVMAAAKRTGGDAGNNEIKKLVAEALEPAIRDHFVTLLDLPQGLVPADVLAASLREEHKAVLLEKLRENHRLAEVIKKRGWGREALPTLHALADTPQHIPWDALLLMCQIEDPWIEQRLFEEAVRFPERADVFAIHAVWKGQPRISQPLSRLAAYLWAGVTPVSDNFSIHQPVLLNVKEGNPAALSLALQLASRNGGWHLVQPFLKSLGLPPASGTVDNETAWAPYRHLREADFRYLPAEKRWQLNPR